MMKSVKIAVLAALISAASFAGTAAQTGGFVPFDPQGAGVVSATGSSSLTSLEQQLSGRTGDRQGKPLLITSTSGDSRLHGTAIVYK